MTEPSNLDRLEERLGYRFNDRSLLQEALTHASAGDANNERLEFLGDAVINLVVTEALFRNLPLHDEGKLTELKGVLVSRNTLKRVAESLGIAEYIHTGSGLPSGSELPPSVAGNALEALLGAIYLDCPDDTRLHRARHLALRWLQPEIDQLQHHWGRTRAKQELQIWCQRELGVLPVYEVTNARDCEAEDRFTVQVRIGEEVFTSAAAPNKKDAEHAAAWLAIEGLRASGRIVE